MSDEFVSGQDVQELCSEIPGAEFQGMDYVGAGWDHDMDSVCRVPTEGDARSEGEDIQIFPAESGNYEWAHAGIGGEISPDADLNCDGPPSMTICRLASDSGQLYWVEPSE